MKDQADQAHNSGHSREMLARARDTRHRETSRVTVIGAVIDLLLGVAKLLAGYFAHSQALIADGIHSLSDLLTDGIVLFASRQSRHGPDAEHPYGHGRFETIATVGLAVALVLVATGIAYDAARRLFEQDVVSQPGVLAMVVALSSIAGKEWIYQYTMRVARRHRSEMLRANAWHHRTDAFSSVIVVIGIAGAMAGFTYLDAIAAIGVALMIAHIGWSLGWNALKELADTAVDERQVGRLRECIMGVDGVKDLHLLRTRHAGGQVLLDVHIIINPFISISEGHHISEVVSDRLLKEFEDVTDVTVHIDPEDDEEEAVSLGLPMRGEMLKRIERHFAGHPQAARVERVTLHYLAGKVGVELLISFDDDSHPESCRRTEQQLRDAVEADPLIDSLRVYWY
jgi:cation diffusion facilitator family transporter